MSETDASKTRNRTFDYVTLRLLMGMIAFGLPIVVIWLAFPKELESISASYHTAAQDAFVGLLFIVAAFLIAYRGHTSVQGLLSKLGGVAAALVATFPTSTFEHQDLPSGPVHYAAAALLFLILTFFCYAFWHRTRRSPRAIVRRRSVVYAACGAIMLGCIAVIALASWFFGEAAKELQLTFWCEWIALWAFGIAWIVAGKSLPFLSEPGERPQLFADIKAALQGT